MLKGVTSNKMIALTESEAFPDASKFFDDDYAPWLFCLPWYADHYPISDTHDQNLTEWNIAQFKNDNYLTLGEMHLSNDELIVDDISIYPNPVQNVISINSVIADINSLEIFDVNGKSVLKSFNTTGLDVSMLMSGVYFIIIETNKGRVTKKMIKK